MECVHNLRSYLLGVLTTLMILSIATPVLAAGTTKSIEVTTGTRIYIDDVELHPTDANGNPVDVFYYNGTNYMPIRAISEAFGKPIQWDGKTRSVYIGKHSSDAPAVWLSEMDYFSGTEKITRKITEADNLGNSHYYCMSGRFDRTYKLNGQYSRITGTLYQTYDGRAYTISKDTGLAIYGDGKLLYTNIFADKVTGLEPVAFDIDLTGVSDLRVYFYAAMYYNKYLISIGDVGLWT